MTADDAYYYLTIARNIFQGLGPTFDGRHLTNGFHPLYLLLLYPIALITGAHEAHFLHWALTLLVMFDGAIGILIYLWIRREFGERAARLALLL